MKLRQKMHSDNFKSAVHFIRHFTLQLVAQTYTDQMGSDAFHYFRVMSFRFIRNSFGCSDISVYLDPSLRKCSILFKTEVFFAHLR